MGNFNAVTGTDMATSEDVIGNCDSGIQNDNTPCLITMCSSTNLAIVSSRFRLHDIHRHIWISNDRHMKKDIDNILTKDIGLIKQCKVYRGAEPSANPDHHLIIIEFRISLNRSSQRPPIVRLDVESLATNAAIAANYNVKVCNMFAALSSLSDDSVSVDFSKRHNPWRRHRRTGSAQTSKTLVAVSKVPWYPRCKEKG